MFVPQSRLSRHNIHCERAVPKVVESQSTEPAKLKRLARYLKRERQWRQVFELGGLAKELTVFTDSDWAGCKETRKSSSAGVLILGRHPEGIHTQAEGHCKKQRRGRAVCSSIGSIRSEGGPEHDV